MSFIAALAFAATSLLAVTGCLAAEAAADGASGAPRDVSVRERVALPDAGMYFSGQQQKALGLFGLLGGVAASQSSAGPRDTILGLMSERNIRVDAMLRDRFMQELEKSASLPGAGLAGRGAQVQLEIVRFGLYAIPWNPELRPVVVAKAQLVGADGSVLWSMQRGMSNHSDPDVPARLYEDYLKEPELLRAGFSMACQASSRDLVASLAKALLEPR